MNSYTFMGMKYYLSPDQLILINQHKLQNLLIVSFKQGQNVTGEKAGSKTIVNLSSNQGRKLHFKHASHISCFFPDNIKG